MEQLHDNGGAVGLCGVSHGGLQLHVPHRFIVRLRRVPCPSECIDNLEIVKDVLATP
jgi:hypothetical protein